MQMTINYRSNLYEESKNNRNVHTTKLETEWEEKGMLMTAEEAENWLKIYGINKNTESCSEVDFRKIYQEEKKEKEIVAYCGLYVIQDEGQITNVAVKSTCRGEHIGTNMLNELINQAKNKGAKNFTLEVRLSNKVAIHLYEKLGFKNVGIRKRFYNNPVEDAMIMWFYN